MRVCRTVCAALLLLLPVQPHFAQQTDDGRPKLKDFGSSLKHLKWDSRENKAVEKQKPKNAERGNGEDEVLRVTTDLVTCDVQVVDSQGKTVTGLTLEDFIINEDGLPQTVHHFSLGSDRNVARTIVLLIDYSGSQFPFIKASVAAAKTLVDQLGPKDLMAIVTDDVELLVDFTRDKAKLKKALDSLRDKSELRKFGKSKQFSALMVTVREAFTVEDPRPIVIFQTDGDELFFLRSSVPPVFSIPDREHLVRTPVPDFGQKRPFSLRDVYLAIEKSRVSVYTIISAPRSIEGDGEPMNEQSLNQKAGRAKTDDYRRWTQLAAAGAAIGGWTAYLSPEAAADIYAAILNDINTRYLLGYYPTNKLRDGTRRNVEVQVKGHPEYKVSGRRSYIAAERINRSN